ncbi:MAG: nicotinate-nucleotide adenylyltransferase [Dehalococcoidia bacterium]|nr:nicotinate-nucleotide adenylyltransferase [Dehalococcoidia bacterium]
MNVCVLGGTFDPIHRGHLVVAEVVRSRLSPAEVTLVPAGCPWLKSEHDIASTADRLAMVRLATVEMGLRVSTIEIERPGPSYTVDTLRALKNSLPSGDELYFILGWDNLLDLEHWRTPEEIINLARLVAVPRVGSRVPDLDMLDKCLPGLSRRVVLLDKPEIDISATVIRERVGLKLPIDHLVPEAVARYIHEHNLYQKGA